MVCPYVVSNRVAPHLNETRQLVHVMECNMGLDYMYIYSLHVLMGQSSMLKGIKTYTDKVSKEIWFLVQTKVLISFWVMAVHVSYDRSVHVTNGVTTMME